MNALDRYTEWYRRANKVAKELNLEIAFTTTLAGSGYMTYEVPVVELETTDTHEYKEIQGSIYFN